MVNYRSLTDVVYEYISDQISSGKLKPNASISEAAICKDLEVSRTPVREALMQLSIEGYIERIPRRGFFTRELTEERVCNIYQIIGNLEAMGAVLAVERRQGLDLDGLRDCARQMDQAIAERQYAVYNRLQHRFHEHILQASGNEDLARLVINIKKVFMRQEYIFPITDYDTHALFLEMNKEHWQMIQLIESGDTQALRALFCDLHWNVKYAAYHTYV